jgi:hypothetical protein
MMAPNDLRLAKEPEVAYLSDNISRSTEESVSPISDDCAAEFEYPHLGEMGEACRSRPGRDEGRLGEACTANWDPLKGDGGGTDKISPPSPNWCWKCESCRATRSDRALRRAVSG